MFLENHHISPTDDVFEECFSCIQQKWIQEIETRTAKMIITSPGGTSSKNAEGFRLNIPTVWARDMGITKENRNVKLSYEGGKITIEKDKS